MLESKFAFSARQGVSPATVARWANADLSVMNGRLVDVERTLERLEGRNPARRRDIGPAHDRKNGSKEAQAYPSTPDTPHSRVEADRRKQVALAGLARIKFERLTGSVVDTEVAARAIQAVLDVVERRLRAIRPNLVPKLIAAAPDAEVIRVIVDDEVNAAFTELVAHSGPLSAGAILKLVTGETR